MSTITTKVLTKKKPSRSWCEDGHAPKWQTKRAQLVKAGAISRWRVGTFKRPGQVETVQTDDPDDDGDIIERNNYQANDEESMRTHFLFERARLLFSKRIGGLRTDPFNALPIPSKGGVPV
jgi:hypothetical protein